MLFDAIFLGLFISGWLICGFAPWLAVSVATRGRAGLGYLPLCLFAAVVAGMAVPILGLNDGRGLLLSFAAAIVAPALLITAGMYAHAATAEQRSARHAKEDPQPE